MTPVSSSLGGATNGKLSTKELLADPQFSGSSPFLGTHLQARFLFGPAEQRQHVSDAESAVPDFVNLNLTQPLWRGLASMTITATACRSRRSNIQFTDEQFRQRVIEVVTQAVQAYWELRVRLSQSRCAD